MTRLLIVPLCLVIALSGCEDPAHQQRITQREENLRWTLKTLEEIEGRREENLAGTMDLAGEDFREHVIRSLENPDKVADWMEQDFDRFEERQPIYQKEIQDQLDGDPDNIKKTLPDVIW